MSRFLFIYGVLFSFYFISYGCEGRITSPPDGTQYVFLPGQTAKLKWEFDDDISSVRLRTWLFTSSEDLRIKRLASISRNGSTETSLFDVDIESPSTLVLKNVNQSYNGTYQFILQTTESLTSNVTVFIAKKPRVAVGCPSFNRVNEGDDFTCECRDKDGNPPSNVTWYKDGKQFSETKTERNTLTLSNVVYETHSGNYTCKARSHTGDEFADAKTIQVRVRFKPSSTTITFGPKCVLLGGPCTVTCESSGLPAPSYTISHNGVVVSTTKTYTIDAVKYSDAGIYKCVAKNIVGNDPASANLTVKAGQLNVTIDCPNLITVNEGNDFTCVCTNEGGHFPANLTWYKDGKRISDAHYGRENRLTRTGVTKRDSGNYSCEAQRFTVKDKKIVEVKVAFKPRNTTINIEIKTGSDGVSVVTSITCSSDGFPEPNYNMTLDGIVISSGKVTPYPLQPISASGIFQCIAWNNLGRDSASKTFSDDKNGNGKYDFVLWHIVVLSLSAFIIGFLFSYIVFCAHRRCCGNRKPEQNSEPAQTDGVDTNYQDLDLTKINTEDHYQSLRGNAAASASNDVADDDEESTYTQLSELRDVEDTYQSLT